MITKSGLVTTYEECKNLKQYVRENIGKAETNFFMGADAVEELTESGRLRYELHPEGLLFFVDEGAYEQVMYFVPGTSPFPETTSTKDLILVEPIVSERNREKVASLQNKLIDRGWYLESRNLQISMDLQAEFDLQAETYAEKLAQFGITLKPCTESMAESVKQLWRKYLRAWDVPYEHLNFMSDPDQHVVCAVDANGEVCGAHWWCCKRDMCETRHTVADENHRRQGIGQALHIAAVLDAKERGCTQIYGPLNAENTKSLLMCEKIGFRHNGREIIQFVKEKTLEV